MRAAYASAFNDNDPLAALTVGDAPEPTLPDENWVVVDVRASSLNRHDLWSLRGVGLREEQLPMILGCDAAGVTAEGVEVVVYPVVFTESGSWSILSEHYPGTIAERVAVPAYNLIPKPASVSFETAACLPTAWLTAYRMLVTKARVGKDDAVLVQGAGGGVATAAVILARAIGARVYVTSRDPAKRERIEAYGATAVDAGGRLPERVDAVIETVGEATFDHSTKCAKPGGRIVVSGATTGYLPALNLRRLFVNQLEVLGSSMGTPDELRELLDMCANGTVDPVIDSVHPFSDVRAGFERLHSGDVFGKVVIDHRS
jgi:NADPH:quinone reductase-like Zn-dependent oxidoreductase